MAKTYECENEAMAELAGKIVKTSAVKKTAETQDKALRSQMEGASETFFTSKVLDDGEIYGAMNIKVPGYPNTNFKVNLTPDKGAITKKMVGADLDRLYGGLKDKLFTTTETLKVSDPIALLREIILSKKDPFKDGILSITILKKDEVQGLAGTEILKTVAPAADFLEKAQDFKSSMSTDGLNFTRELVTEGWEAGVVIRDLPKLTSL